MFLLLVVKALRLFVADELLELGVTPDALIAMQGLIRRRLLA
jgi:hypothetical protein